MGIQGIAGISSVKEQYPKLVIPVTDTAKSGAQNEQVGQNRGDFLQRGAVSEEPSEEERGLPEHLETQVKQANRLAESLDRSLRFFVHADSGRAAVNVVENSSHQVIKTIPPERFLDFVARVKKVFGIFFDEFV